RQDAERIRDPMLARLGYGEGQLALQQSGADQAPSALRGDGMHGMNIRIAAAEGDDAVSAPPSGLQQAVAMRGVVRKDRNPAWRQPLEDFRVGVGDRLLRSEILDMRGGDGGDQ